MPKFRIAVDMHGGDGGIASVSSAVLSAEKELDKNVEFVLCGRENEIKAEFSKKRSDFSFGTGRFVICDSQAISDIKTNVSRIWRTSPELSIVKCISLQKDKEVSASFSAGDTGVLYSSAIFLLGKESGIDRAALAVVIPTVCEKLTVLLDIGANVECTAKHLFQFAVLGEKYCRKITKENKPKIGLFNIGSETHKGTLVIKDAAEMIKKVYGEQFVGSVEGNEIFDAKADVVVCDGFCGNAILKTSESLYRFIQKRIVTMLPPEALKKMMRFDKSFYGCAPILGVKGNVFKAHGNSDVETLSRAIIRAVKSLDQSYETDNL